MCIYAMERNKYPYRDSTEQIKAYKVLSQFAGQQYAWSRYHPFEWMNRGQVLAVEPVYERTYYKDEIGTKEGFYLYKNLQKAMHECIPFSTLFVAKFTIDKKDIVFEDEEQIMVDRIIDKYEVIKEN